MAAHSSSALGISSTTNLPIVLFVHGSAEMYGADKVLLNLAEGLARAGEFQPVVALHEDGPLRAVLVEGGIEVHVMTVLKITRAMYTPIGVRSLPRLASAACRNLDNVVAGRRIALVHSNTLAVLGGALWARRRGHRHVWHVHEIILKPALARRGLPWIADRLSHCVVSISPATETWLLGQVPRLANRSVVVPNGLPSIPVPDWAAVSSFRRMIRADDGHVVATVAGRLNHWKGQGLLIEAAALLKREGRLGALRIAIVGDVFAGHEDFKSRLVAQVQLLGLEDEVRFVPFVRDIYAVWHGSQIAVVPSTEPEPFGMVAIEAMACKVPVVAAAHGGLLDIVDDQVTGILFEPGSVRGLADALARIGGDSKLRRAWGEAGMARQQMRFSLDRQVEHMSSVYRRLVNKDGFQPSSTSQAFN